MSGCYLQTKTRWKNLNKQLIIFIKLREFLFWRFKKQIKAKLQIQSKYIYIYKKRNTFATVHIIPNANSEVWIKIIPLGTLFDHTHSITDTVYEFGADWGVRSFAHSVMGAFWLSRGRRLGCQGFDSWAIERWTAGGRCC